MIKMKKPRLKEITVQLDCIEKIEVEINILQEKIRELLSFKEIHYYVISKLREDYEF